MEIIVASSNLFRRELSSFILSEAGYTVHEANDSYTLLHWLDQTRPSLILLDERLKGSNEVDIAQCIRQHDGSVRIMVLTSSSALIESVQALSTLGDDHLKWPYQAEDLLSHVQTLLHHDASASRLVSAY